MPQGTASGVAQRGATGKRAAGHRIWHPGPVFIGHFALAFGAKRIEPRASLGLLFAACQLADLVWPLLVLAGVEAVEVRPGDTRFTPLEFVRYPYSHSLLAVAVWAAALGVAALAGKARGRTALVAALLVVSHWVLDALTHRPDLPLWPGGSARVGLGLWNSVAGTLAVEVALFAGGVALYAAATSARDRRGALGLWGLVGFLALAYVAAAFGPPPPDGRAVATTALAMWLLVLWAWWVDRHRQARGGAL